MTERLHELAQLRKYRPPFSSAPKHDWVQQRDEIFALLLRLCPDLTGAKARALGHRYQLPFDLLLEINYRLSPGPRVRYEVASAFGLPLDYLPSFKPASILAAVRNLDNLIVGLHDEKLQWLAGTPSVHIVHPKQAPHGVSVCTSTFEADVLAITHPHQTTIGTNGCSEAAISNVLSELSATNRWRLVA